jgi:subtilisin-like proprotein convertase family protein
VTRAEITRMLVGGAVALTLSAVIEAASAGRATPLEPAVIVTQTNSTSLTVPGSGTGTGTGAPASLYPSSVTVSGALGVVLDANVTLNSLSHTCTRDVDVLLVGPGGQNLVVMSDVAGCSATSNATVTIDDEAAAPFPLTTTPLTTSSYQPLDNDAPGADAFPAPAPAPTAATSLTTFDGTNPNGTWSLYVVDDASGDTGTISGGWTLTLDVGSAALPGALQFASPTYSAGEGDGTATIAISRTGGDDGAVSVQFSTVAGGTATAGSDYTSTTQTVNFADGVTSANASVPILDDPDSEGINETVNLQLSAPTGGATLGSQSTATLAIEDNDSSANTTPLALPGTGSGNPSGAPASTYPSNIRRQGLSGTVLDVNVTINNFSHALTGDVDLLLVSPSGQRATIMSDLGTAATSGATFTIDDEAATPLPAGPIANGGTYKPLDVDTAGADAFPAPAPSESGSSALSTFDGTSPNGTWSLYVVDDASGDTGSIMGGWTLTITRPTATRIVSFSAQQPAARGPVALRWRTGSEAGVLGFHVFGVARGGSVRLNRALIPARYGLRGGGYTLRVPGRRAFASYRLELVMTDGTRVRGPTVRLRRAR